MARKQQKPSMTETQIASQEARIPEIALKAFSNAYKAAIANGASVLIAQDGQLYEVTETDKKSVRFLGVYGSLKSGTRLQIKKQAAKAVS